MLGSEENNTNFDLKEQIRQEALRLGFSFCGFARCEPLEELRPFYSNFIKRESRTELGYLESNLEKRLHPELLLQGAKSVIALMMNYFPKEVVPEADNFIISKYAYGGDYHQLIRERLNLLTNQIKQLSGNFNARLFVDSGPMLEKAWSQKCGVGWQGKNTLIINKSAGSFFFIGIVLTDLELEPDPPETDHCGKCDKCVKACPTGALDTPYQLKITKCIAFLTIESKEEIPDSLKEKLSDRIYGCDICQDACPYNFFATPHSVMEFLPPRSLLSMRKRDWLKLSETDFDQLFENSPVKRAGYQRLMRNIRSVLPNSTA
jgi:epoxyqueuosine reductase